MKIKELGAVLSLAAGFTIGNAHADLGTKQSDQGRFEAQQQIIEPAGAAKGSAEEVIRNWKAKPKEVAQQMIQKYGQPQEVTSQRLIWHNNGPWKRTELINEEIPHNFPMPHQDMLEQVVNFEVPADKFSDLAAYDGSVIVERTRGEISARCDKEAANFLALNLAHDIVTGKRSVDEARDFYAKTIMGMKEGKQHAYLQRLQFETERAATAGDPDVASPLMKEAAGAPADEAPDQKE